MGDLEGDDRALVLYLNHALKKEDSSRDSTVWLECILASSTLNCGVWLPRISVAACEL